MITIDVEYFVKYIVDFLKKNPLYLFCSITYVLSANLFLGGTIISLIICITAYIISLCVVFSPIGEKLLRLIENVRPLYTKREKEYLLPIFEEVYEEAKTHNPELELELCVIDQMHANACALGRHTIAVTKGAIDTFSEDELKAIICHEIGHVANKDTIAMLYLLVGNGLFSVIILAIKFMLNLFELVAHILSKNGFIRFIASLIRFIFQILLFYFMIWINIIVAINSRKNEFRADEYAYKLGYGYQMTEALYLLEKISLSEKSTIITKMLASHPILPKRIANIERLQDNEEMQG